jgi:plasmid stabilization system protein ParE
MKLRWTRNASLDLERLHEFLHTVNVEAADQVARRLLRAPERLIGMPRPGVRVEGFPQRKVGRIIVDSYEIQYELIGETISILRVWHTRENR